MILALYVRLRYFLPNIIQTDCAHDALTDLYKTLRIFVVILSCPCHRGGVKLFRLLEFALSRMFRSWLATPATRRLFTQEDAHVRWRCVATAATLNIRGNAAQGQAEAIEKQREQRILHVVEQKIAYRQKLEREACLLAPHRKKTLIFGFRIVCRPRTPSWTKPL